MLPHDFPSWKTGYHYFRVWRFQGGHRRSLELRSEELSLKGIVSVLDPDHLACFRMLKIMEKAGMCHEGTDQFYGRKIFVYSASREMLADV